MAKYDVSVIEREAIDTRRAIHGLRGADVWLGGPMTNKRARTYCDKVLWLCKRIRKLEQSDGE
jgi:hypothetical protein